MPNRLPKAWALRTTPTIPTFSRYDNADQMKMFFFFIWFFFYRFRRKHLQLPSPTMPLPLAILIVPLMRAWKGSTKLTWAVLNPMRVNKMSHFSTKPLLPTISYPTMNDLQIGLNWTIWWGWQALSTPLRNRLFSSKKCINMSLMLMVIFVNAPIPTPSIWHWTFCTMVIRFELQTSQKAKA